MKEKVKTKLEEIQVKKQRAERRKILKFKNK